MRSLTIGIGLCLAVVACGDSDPTGGSGGTGASGGSGQGGSVTGGAGGSGGNNGLGGAGGSATGGNGTGGNAIGGAGGGTGDPCADACTKAAACGLPANQCAGLIDCATPQGVCYAGCVNDPTVDCNAIFGALQGSPGPLTDCVNGCQGTGGGGVGGGGVGGGGVGGGGNVQACQTCAQNSCTSAAFQCFQMVGQAECQAWVSCAQACTDAACLDTCTTMHPGGAPIEQCMCSTCASDCSPVCN
ncbi:MAG: hypothetical protein U0271_45575 [Polyangiaceae bacterium]